MTGKGIRISVITIIRNRNVLHVRFSSVMQMMRRKSLIKHALRLLKLKISVVKEDRRTGKDLRVNGRNKGVQIRKRTRLICLWQSLVW